MNKNRYNFPEKARNSNNMQYDRYVEDMYYTEDYAGPADVSEEERTPRWKKNGRLDIFHEPDDNTDWHQDPYTVAQHYIDRTRRPHG